MYVQNHIFLLYLFIFSVEPRYKSDPVLVHVIRTKASVERHKSIRGLAILGSELFVVSEESSAVEVYDSMEFSFSRQWTSKELINPEDIASSNTNKCIYCTSSIAKLNERKS